MRFVFVTGMGRSGTRFVAELLGKAEQCRAVHEGIADRKFWLLSWYLDERLYAIPYLEQMRRQLEASAAGEEVFVDVNSYLQNAVPALRRVFHDPAVFHLVRDPRKVIPSIYGRRSDRDLDRLPRTSRGIIWWFQAGRFEQICWNWADTTRRLLDAGVPTIRFEDLTCDFTYLSDRLASPCGICIDRVAWSEMRSRKVNRTRSRLYRMLYARVRGKPYVRSIPVYEQWSPEMKDSYMRICGETAAEVGYV